MWEVALTLTKPKDIKKIIVSPIIGSDIQSMGEGEVYSYLKIHIETECEYAEIILGWNTTYYKDDSERKNAEETQMLLMSEFIENRMNDGYINSFWRDFRKGITWKRL